MNRHACSCKPVNQALSFDEIRVSCDYNDLRVYFRVLDDPLSRWVKDTLYSEGGR